MILCIYVKVQPKPANGGSNGEDLNMNEPVSPLHAEGHQVKALIQRSDCRRLPASKKRPSQVFPRLSSEPSTRSF